MLRYRAVLGIFLFFYIFFRKSVRLSGFSRLLYRRTWKSF
nr:MAG TPA: hypothetical protein [Caudoviricetes sp.]